jgi:thioesterase domain-containing protein
LLFGGAGAANIVTSNQVAGGNQMTRAPGAAERTATLQRYLHAHIPLARSIEITVLEASPQRVVLAAPLAPNLNAHGTVFGGSAAAVALLAAWSMVYTRLVAEGITARLVIQSNKVDYRLPIAGDFRVTAAAPEASAWESFSRTLLHRGRGRIRLVANLECDGEIVARLEGSFVAMLDS